MRNKICINVRQLTFRPSCSRWLVWRWHEGIRRWRRRHRCRRISHGRFLPFDSSRTRPRRFHFGVRRWKTAFQRRNGRIERLRRNDRLLNRPFDMDQRRVTRAFSPMFMIPSGRVRIDERVRRAVARRSRLFRSRTVRMRILNRRNR